MTPFMKRHPAFSLIELLLTISIIATLLTLILPAIKAARENARTGQCQSNLKQIHLALTSYSHDFHDFLPTPSAGLSWVSAIGNQGYLGNSQPKAPYITLNTTNVSNTRWVPFKCPSEIPQAIRDAGADYNGTPTTCWDNDYVPTSYAMNITVTPRLKSGAYSYGQPRARWTTGTPSISPSQARFLADSKLWSARQDMPCYSASIDTFPGDKGGYFNQYFHAFRHAGTQNRSNFAYIDGHVDAREHVAYSGQTNFQILFPSIAQ
jgi:prepilin-type processing-associated H-X9-DG protein